MSSTDASIATSTEVSEVGTVDMKLEVVTLPASDVDRAKGFYESLGWRFDIDLVVATTSGRANPSTRTQRFGGLTAGFGLLERIWLSRQIFCIGPMLSGDFGSRARFWRAGREP